MYFPKYLLRMGTANLSYIIYNHFLALMVNPEISGTSSDFGGPNLEQFRPRHVATDIAALAHDVGHFGRNNAFGEPSSRPNRRFGHPSHG